MFDTQSRLLFCNTQYRDLFPRSAYARVQGAHIADILAAVVLTGERENMPIEMTKESIGEAAATLHENKDETFRLYDGRWIQMRTRVGQNGSVLVVASDVTAAKESELVLRKLAEQMKGLAETDALTGVANRRSFDSRLAQEVQDAAKGAYPLALLLIDVDRFKAYNDMYGHLAGDSCLKLIGRCLSDAAKCEDDLPARYGGEEFAIILPRRNGEEALAAANALRHRVWDLDLAHAGSELGSVTVSIGVATIVDANAEDTPAELIARADTALYCSKNDGRNRATLAAETFKKALPRRA